MKEKATKKNSRIPVVIRTEFIKLQDAVKYSNAAESGGMAKTAIQEGKVQVNGEICTMRGKKLYPGDCFTFLENTYLICIHESY